MCTMCASPQPFAGIVLVWILSSSILRKSMINAKDLLRGSQRKRSRHARARTNKSDIPAKLV